MGDGAQENKKTAQGNGRNVRANNKTTRENKAGRKQKPRPPEPVTADLIKIVLDHSFPDFNKWLREMADPRKPERIIYSSEHMLHLGLSMFLFHCGSRNQLESERRTMAFYQNLLVLCGTDEAHVATAAAMNNFMRLMNPHEGMDILPGEMTRALIRSRALDRFRNSSGEFMVAVDGVHLFTRKGVHPNSVQKTTNGEKNSYYYALEAKLVTEDGMGLSLATVFIETEKEFDKEDCELNAFYRLEKILQKRFPRMRICMLLDGLYANKNVLDICAENQWAYYITLKEGSLPKVAREAKRQMEDSPNQYLGHSPETGVYQNITWALSVRHGNKVFHVLRCEEITVTKKGIEKNVFQWLTDTWPSKENAAELVREARCRWVVEETFNIQKNGGYGLEHNYGTMGFAMKNYYFLLQMAHTLHQLISRTDLFLKLQKRIILHRFEQLPEEMKNLLAVMAATTRGHFRTVKNLVKRLGESFRTQLISELATDADLLGRIQLRFDSS